MSSRAPAGLKDKNGMTTSRSASYRDRGTRMTDCTITEIRRHGRRRRIAVVGQR
jgi:hypothetical protein